MAGRRDLAAGRGRGNGRWQSLAGSFSNDLSVEGTDSRAAYDTLAKRLPETSGDALQVVLHDKRGVTSAKLQRAVGDALAEVAKQDGVASVQSPYGDPQRQRGPQDGRQGEQPAARRAPAATAAQPRMVSEDETSAIATVRFAERAADVDAARGDDRARRRDRLRTAGVHPAPGGPRGGSSGEGVDPDRPVHGWSVGAGGRHAQADSRLVAAPSLARIQGQRHVGRPVTCFLLG